MTTVYDLSGNSPPVIVDNPLRTTGKWNDIRFPATAINPPGAASDPTLDAADGLLSFAAAATNTVAIAVQMPHGWAMDTPIEPHVHWMKTTSAAGDVVWELKYQYARINGVFPGSYTTITTTTMSSIVTDTNTALQHLISDFAAITIPSPDNTESVMILCLLSRLGGDGADTYGAACKLLEFDIHYQASAIGSSTEYGDS